VFQLASLEAHFAAVMQNGEKSAFNFPVRALIERIGELALPFRGVHTIFRAHLKIFQS
jgi:hypothetical protein